MSNIYADAARSNFGSDDGRDAGDDSTMRGNQSGMAGGNQNLGNTGSGLGQSSSSSSRQIPAAITRDAPGVSTMPLLGKGPVPVDKRKFQYDRVLGRVGRTPWSVTKDDRMSASEAGETMTSILKMFGLDRLEEKDIDAFVSAMFFAHTVNSGSTLQPGRAVIEVAGTRFDYIQIVRKLGIDIRRFFRAYANEIREVNQEIIKSYDPYDPVKAEFHGWIMQVAAERGLQRYPYLAHDSADACTNLSPAERAAIASSKRFVLNTVDNSADSMMANPRTGGGSKFNSTTLGMEMGRD